MGMSNHFGHQYGDPKVIIPLDTKMGFKLARDDVAWPHIVSNSGEQLADTVFYRNFLNWSKMVVNADMDILAIIGGAGHPGLLRGTAGPASADKLKRKTVSASGISTCIRSFRHSPRLKRGSFITSGT